MQPEKKYNEDLDYLADSGFERVKTSTNDLEELRQKIRIRSNGGTHTAFVSLVTGIFLAVTVFFAAYDTEVAYPAVSSNDLAKDQNVNQADSVFEEIELDTLTVSTENFTKPKHSMPVVEESKTPAGTARERDSLQVVELNSQNITGQNPDKSGEGKLRFLINSPVTYIHDMKITDYKMLYFKRGKINDLRGIPAAFAGDSEQGNGGTHLRSAPENYLHEEIAKAMLYFKKGKYDECLNSLELIFSYNVNDVNCSFYKGMCFYYKKNYAKAIHDFNLCLDNNNNAFAQEAMYYKALSLDESGKKEDAMSLFRQIVESGDFYAGKAKERIDD